jgi:hypothetical protein
MLRVSAA